MFVQLWLETVSTFQILITNAEQVNSEIYLLFRFSVHYTIIGMKVFCYDNSVVSYKKDVCVVTEKIYLKFYG